MALEAAVSAPNTPTSANTCIRGDGTPLSPFTFGEVLGNLPHLTTPLQQTTQNTRELREKVGASTNPTTPTFVSTATPNVTPSNATGKKARKKTVAEMLLTESFCLPSITKEILIGFIVTSQILEADRKKYLLNEISRASLGIAF